MVGRPKPLNFLNYELGHVQEFPVRTEARPGHHWMTRLVKEGRPHREWVALEDGRKVSALYKNQKLELSFGRHSDVQRVRHWLHHASPPCLARLELTATPQGILEGTLALSQSALAGELEEAPEILLSDAVVEQIGGGSVERTRDELIGSGGISSPWPEENFVLVMQVPIRFRREERDEEPEIRWVLANGHDLRCRLEGKPGRQYLKAMGYERRKKEVKTRLPGVHFVRVRAMPRLVDDEEEIEGTNLEDLTPIQNDHLTAWVEYEWAERERRKALLERRQQVDLEYDEVVDGPRRGSKNDDETRWTVRIRNGIADCQKWLAEKGEFTGKVEKIDAFVELHSLHSGGDVDGVESANHATIEKFEKDHQMDRIIATITWKEHDSPPNKGKLVACSHYGNEKQEERRDEALKRLRCGQSANPDLLRYIFFPQAIPSIEGKDIRMWHRPGAPRLNESQKKAVIRAAKEPSLLLIQGPPGTGKTTVIAESIHQLRHRYRNRGDGEPGSGSGPLRVLVSSIQNDAVANAADKLGSEDVFVDRHVRGEGEDRATELRGREIAGKLWRQMEARPAFQRYRRLCGLSRAVETLAPHLGSQPRRSLSYIEEFESSDAFDELGNNVRDDLDMLKVRLRELMADEIVGKEKDIVDEEPELPQDFRAALKRLTEAPESLLESDFSAALDLVVELEGLLEEGPEHVRNRGRELAQDASSCRRGLRRAIKTGELRPRYAKKWTSLREEARRLLAGGDEQEESDVEAISPHDEWLKEAQRWLGRAREDIAERLEEFAAREEAIVFDWISTLNDRPTVMQKVVTEYAPVRATTCQKSSKFYDDERPYDVVIIDEAARGGLDVLIPMTMGRSIILVGDQNQLPPHVEDELERQLEEDIRRNVDLKETWLFSYLWDELGGPVARTNCVSLTTQYRMHRDIGEVVSKAFYEPEGLKLDHDCSGGSEAKRAPVFGLFNDEPFVWLDTSDVLQDGSTRRAQDISWPCHMSNHYEAKLIIDVLNGLSKEGLEELRAREDGKPIGLIPFYREQLNLLRRLVDRYLPHLRDDIELKTADSFQGKDFPLVILSTVRSNNAGKVGFLELPNRINVGISRAKNQVILVGDRVTLTKGSEPFERVWKVIKGDSGPGIVVPSSDVT